MAGLTLFFASYPFWAWLAVAAVLLAVEVATGSGWLLWPAASAFAVGGLTLAVRLGAPIEISLFAVLTIASTYLARRYLRPVLAGHDPDLNDPSARLLGRRGEAVESFDHGLGRVFVDGKEWAATAQAPAPAVGAAIEVVAVDGAILTVRAV